MKIFYTCTTRSLMDDYMFHIQLIARLKEEGHKITYEWIEGAYENIKKGIVGDTEKFYEQKQNAIKNSEVVIVEGSYKSFSIGHQITVALQKAKPTLVLYRNNDEIKNNESYVEGIKSDWLIERPYKNIDHAVESVKAFLKMYKNANKYRFNLVLSQPENMFLEELMKDNHKTKTQLIKDLIRKEMDKKI